MKKIRLISLEQLLEMMENGEKFRLVEVLSAESYASGHIPGAINVPFTHTMTQAQMAKAAQQAWLKKPDTIVVYCASYSCHASTNAARLLLAAGFSKTLDYKAGKNGWNAAGLELET